MNVAINLLVESSGGNQSITDILDQCRFTTLKRGREKYKVGTQYPLS